MILTIHHPKTINAVMKFLSQNPELMDAEKSMQPPASLPQLVQTQTGNSSFVEHARVKFVDGMALKRNCGKTGSNDWRLGKHILASVKNGRFIVKHPKTGERMEFRSLSLVDTQVLGFTAGNIWKRWLYLGTDERWYSIEAMRHAGAVPPSIVPSAPVTMSSQRGSLETSIDGEVR